MRGWALGGSSHDGRIRGDRFRPQDLGLWDPFQMAFFLIILGFLTILTDWDVPPSGPKNQL